MDRDTLKLWVQIGAPIVAFFLLIIGISSGNMVLVGVAMALMIAALALVMMVF